MQQSPAPLLGDFALHARCYETELEGATPAPLLSQLKMCRLCLNGPCQSLPCLTLVTIRSGHGFVF